MEVVGGVLVTAILVILLVIIALSFEDGKR